MFRRFMPKTLFMKGYDSISVHIFDIFADRKKHVSRSEGERRPHLWNSKYLRVPGLLLIWSFVTENKKKLLIFTLSIIDFVFQIFNQGLLGLPTDMLGLWSRTRTQKAAFIIRFYKVKDHVNLTPFTATFVSEQYNRERPANGKFDSNARSQVMHLNQRGWSSLWFPGWDKWDLASKAKCWSICAGVICLQSCWHW